MWEDAIVQDVHRTREASRLNSTLTSRRSSPISGSVKPLYAEGLCPQKNGPNQWLKLTRAAISALRVPPHPRRRRQLSLIVRVSPRPAGR